jgi:hypothetical protein
MNDRQRDLFLYLWSRRREPGPAAVALRGALIGGLGGLVFAILMLGETGADRGGYTGLSALLPLFERGGVLIALSVPAFAWIGYLGASRLYASQEAMYQAMLAAGARVPEQKPAMQARDRGPALAVAIAVLAIVAFIAALWVMYG